jgi:hypothetical protein
MNNPELQPNRDIGSQSIETVRPFDFDQDYRVISTIEIDGIWVVLSRYGDDIWQLTGFPSNVSEHYRHLDFSRIPTSFRIPMKGIIYRYLRHGRPGQRRPKGATLSKFFANSRIFFQYLLSVGIERLSDITPAISAGYVAACRTHRQTHRHHGQPLSRNALSDRFQLVERLYELSQFTDDRIPQHPWPDSSAMALAGLTGSPAHRGISCTTPLMPDEVFCKLFKKAVEVVQQGKQLLDIRDTLNTISKKHINYTANSIAIIKKRYLDSIGFVGGNRSLKKMLLELRTACYIVLASTSGCRNHELANLEIGAHHRTQDDEGTHYHWMRSRSEKTNKGIHDWMIPEISVQVLRLMERWAEPYQSMIAVEISVLKISNRLDPLIEKLRAHRNALFLGEKDRKARTLSGITWGSHLKLFAKNLSIDWPLASHQFRRKFANYVAHSKFGDLRYLSEHFAHWTLDMSLSYAVDSTWGHHSDLELFDDIQTELQHIKRETVHGWLNEQSLAGGYGVSLKNWQSNSTNITTFKNLAAMVNSIAVSSSIRSTGHGWCTADDNRCIGNTLEKTRCSDCDHAVIGNFHARFYQVLHDNLEALLNIEGIGESGRQRVLLDLRRCREVLTRLGFQPRTN